MTLCYGPRLPRGQATFHAASIQLDDFRFKMQMYLLTSNKRSRSYLEQQFQNKVPAQGSETAKKRL